MPKRGNGRPEMAERASSSRRFRWIISLHLLLLSRNCDSVLLAVKVRKVKLRQMCPTFEKLNRDRLKSCEETQRSAQHTVDHSKELIEQARDLVTHLRAKRVS
jgi:hypothetical protein